MSRRLSMQELWHPCPAWPCLSVQRLEGVQQRAHGPARCPQKFVTAPIVYCLLDRRPAASKELYTITTHFHHILSPPRCCLARIKQRPFSNACSVNHHSFFGDF